MTCERTPEIDPDRSSRNCGSKPGLSADIHTLKNFIVVEVRGKITMASSPELRQILNPLYSGDKGIIVDLSRVSAMDSSGVATLVEGLKWRHRTQKAFILIGVRSRIHDLFSLTKLDTSFILLPDPLTDFLSENSTYISV